MKSIVPVLDPILNKNILIPGISEPIPIDISDNFFFIICQNDSDSLGRNCVPDILQSKIRNIKYPMQSLEEIENICVKKRNNEFGNRKEFNEDTAKLLAKFMIEFNNLIEKYRLPLLKWSFRDIDKIIKRISNHIYNFYNFGIKNNLKKVNNNDKKEMNKKNDLIEPKVDKEKKK